MRILCWLRYRPNIFGIAPIEGHRYYETYHNDDVHILKCMECGQYEVGYYNGGEPEPPTLDDLEANLKELKAMTDMIESKLTNLRKARNE